MPAARHFARPRALTLAALCCCAAAVWACGGGSSGGDVTDPGAAPTATLPAPLPTPIIISGGAVQPGGGTTYTIRSGDTLASIASRFGVSLEDLRAANPDLDPTALSVGDVVRLPAVEGAPSPAPTEDATATPESEDTPEATDTAGPTNTPSSLGQTYIVQSGDIPVTIAEQFGITVEALLAANPGINPNNLQVGDVLVIPPAPAETPAPPAE